MIEKRANLPASRGSGAVGEVLATSFERFLERGLRRIDRDGRWWEGAFFGATTPEPMSGDGDRMDE